MNTFNVKFLVEQNLDNETALNIIGTYQYSFGVDSTIITETIEEAIQYLLIYTLNEQNVRIGEPRKYVIGTTPDELTESARLAIAEQAFTRLIA